MSTPPVPDDRKLPYGLVNSIEQRQRGPGKAFYNVAGASFFKAAKEIVQDRYTPDTLAGAKEFQAFALKVLPENVFMNVSSFMIDSVLGQKHNSIRVIARIPELHAHLPFPRDSDDMEILSMYPIFEGSAATTTIPNAGQLIRVSFQNVYDQSSPVYLGTVTGEGSLSMFFTLPKLGGAGSAQESFAGGSALAPAGKITELGGWTGAIALQNPEKYGDIAKSRGVNMLDIMVNDISNDVVAGPRPFHTYDLAKVRRAFAHYQSEGIACSMTTWAAPRADWMAGMRNVIGPLATELNVPSITLDLEEPWITPLRKKTAAEISIWNTSLIAALRSTYKGKIGVAPIVYANSAVMDGICQLVDYIIPQCYSTVKNTGKRPPGELERIAYDRYKKFNKEFIMGAAAWNLKGAYGLDPANALRAALNATLQLGITKVRYWRYDFLYGDILSVIKEFV